ncbi:dodecin family protein [Desulfocurvibacter africanus]|jgi:flavin-binding protein dodecin|uniref:Dodecin domain-containing protein n=2 Tax=Desulfocurvibacter africanus TaxID=873 RepID=F3Z466_DESAF|nr:dodecin family protein [Desulfocurvibacter africanus]EGJ51608.1 protein of unknown function DUF1458 [Desulfocurvibacter africanus subsp. africanus str. Walvis Bay]EMG37587.1 hypothetical protein PCS_01525 [Desulfocurvibacter africanus PCS]
MAVVKTIEIIAQSEKGFEDAVRTAVSEVAKSVRNIVSVWIKEFEAKVENNQVTVFRVTTKISFMVEK